MPKSQPYQPLPLRILHGSIAILIILALITGVLIYNIFDGRFGHLPLREVPRIMGIHKLFGRLFLFIIPLFAWYSFHPGKRRLIQTDSLSKLALVGKPIWWYTIHRIVNTLMLMAATFALFSGRQMDERWMQRGELTHIWYTLHLVSWIVMFFCLAVHLLMIAKVGGVPLMLSIFDTKSRANDSLAASAEKIKNWMRKPNL